MTDTNISPGEVLVPRRDLGLDFEEHGLAYLDAEFHVSAESQEDGSTRFDVAVDHDPLDGFMLMEMLKKVAPYGGNTTFFGVIADWDVVDRAKGARSDSLPATLVERHERLGKPWEEFMKSRGRWLSLFIDSSGPNVETSNSGGRYVIANPFVAEEDITVQKVARDTAQMTTDCFDTVVKMFEEAGIKDGRERMLSAAQSFINQRRHPNRQLTAEQKVQRHFGSLHATNRETILARLFSQLDKNEISGFLASSSDTIYDWLELNNGHRYGIPRSYLGQQLGDGFLEKDSFQSGEEVIQAGLVRLATGERMWVKLPESAKSGQLRRVITPTISWRNEGGRRSFILEHSTVHDGRINFQDGVLGVMATAYLAPEVTDDWPWSRQIPGGSLRSQIMGVAQVPVLALMHQRQLLDTDFIAAAEDIAKPERDDINN